MKELRKYWEISLNGIFEKGANKIILSNTNNDFIVASYESNFFCLLDSNGNLIRRFDKSQGRLTCAAFSQDDDLVAVGDYWSTIILYERLTGNKIWISPNFIPNQKIEQIHFISSTELIGISGNHIGIFSVSKGTLLRKIPFGTKDIFDVNLDYDKENNRIIINYIKKETIRPKGLFAKSYVEFHEFLEVINLDDFSSFSENMGYTTGTQKKSRLALRVIESNLIVLANNEHLCFYRDRAEFDKLTDSYNLNMNAIDISNDKKYVVIGGRTNNFLFDIPSRSLIKKFNSESEKGSRDIKFSKNSKLIYSLSIDKSNLKIWNLHDLII